MRLGYNTNGLPHHRLLDAIALLADLGYQSVAITLDVGALDPYQDPSDLNRQILAVRRALEHAQLRSVIETGARFLLNPRQKHDPTLLDPDPARRTIRQDFLIRSIAIARQLGSDCVSLWSGKAPDDPPAEVALDRLVQALEPVLHSSEAQGVPIAFEPEPGMFIDTLASFRQLDERIAQPCLQLTVDLGHVHCLREGPWEIVLPPWRGRILNIHIEDMVENVHEHLMFGDGTMDFPRILAVLRDIEYRGSLHVELSRHGHMAAEASARAMEALRQALASPGVRS